MRDGYKIIDMDTHVNPSLEVLEKYVDPSFRPRLSEFDLMKRTRTGADGIPRSQVTVGAIPYDRFPGTAPRPEDDAATPGGRMALDGRVGSFHRAPVASDVQEENSDGRIQDMDLEGRDIDFIFPGTWAASLTGIQDPTLGEGLYRAYHRYMSAYTAKHPDRLKSALQVPGGDVEWAVSEVREWANEKWVAAVWVHLPEGRPVDHPDLEPLWATMNDLDLPLVHHSFFQEAPYFPGYKDIWGNVIVARTAAHPWGASRLAAYLMISGIFDRYPNFRAAVCEVGHGWLPNWVIRLGFHLSYIKGMSPDLKYTPLEYVQQGRFRCAAEFYEGPEMTKACIEILGEDCLMHQSDYPHGQCLFPETSQTIMEWPIWSNYGPDALKKHMYDNAASYLRLT